MGRRGRIKNTLAYAAFLVFRFLARTLPESLSYALGRGVGVLAYRLLPERRRSTEDNIRKALGLPDEAAARLAREASAALGLLGAEFLWFSARRSLLAERVEIKGEEHIQSALAEGRGAILLHAHLGNWELCGQALGMAGYRIHPVVQIQASGSFYAAIDRERRLCGMRPIVRGFSLREMLRVLRQGECVLIMPDQDAGRKGVFIPFFGRPASTPRGIAVLARLSGSPVVPVFIHRLRPGYHQIRFHPPLAMERTGDEDADTIANLTKINELLEGVISEFPEQWFWMHKRWKTKPRMGGKPV